MNLKKKTGQSCMCLLNALRLYSCSGGVFLEVPVPFQNTCSSQWSPVFLAGWSTELQPAVSEGHRLRTGPLPQPDFNIPACSSWPVQSAILPGVIRLIAHMMRSPDACIEVLTRFQICKGKGWMRRTCCHQNSSCSCPGAVQEKRSCLGFIFNWRNYQGGVCYVFQRYLSLSHRVRRKTAAEALLNLRCMMERAVGCK